MADPWEKTDTEAAGPIWGAADPPPPPPADDPQPTPASGDANSTRRPGQRSRLGTKEKGQRLDLLSCTDETRTKSKELEHIQVIARRCCAALRERLIAMAEVQSKTDGDSVGFYNEMVDEVNRYDGRDDPAVAETLGVIGDIIRETLDWTSSLPEPRHMPLSFRQASEVVHKCAYHVLEDAQGSVRKRAGVKARLQTQESGQKTQIVEMSTRHDFGAEIHRRMTTVNGIFIKVRKIQETLRSTMIYNDPTFAASRLANPPVEPEKTPSQNKNKAQGQKRRRKKKTVPQTDPNEAHDAYAETMDAMYSEYTHVLPAYYGYYGEEMYYDQMYYDQMYYDQRYYA